MRWSRQSGQKQDVYYFCYGNQNQRGIADKRRKYDQAFKAKVLRLTGESRSTQAAARQPGISPKMLYRWQQAQRVAEGAVKKWRVTRRCVPCGPASSGPSRSSTF